MKRIRRAYSKTVSLIDETAVQIYQSFVGKKKGFLLESYDKNNGRYVFMGKNPEEVIKSKENGLVIEKADGTTKELSGNPVDLLKGYYSDFEIRKDDEQLAFTGGLVELTLHFVFRMGVDVDAEVLPAAHLHGFGVTNCRIIIQMRLESVRFH